ncbi:MAG: YbjN domain-containing protein [Pseudomonadota bacterium]
MRRGHQYHAIKGWYSPQSTVSMCDRGQMQRRSDAVRMKGKSMGYRSAKGWLSLLSSVFMLAAASVVAPAPAAAQEASASEIEGMSAAAVAAVLREAGLTASIDTSVPESPLITSAFAGLAFAVEGYSCRASGCSEYLFEAVFELESPASLNRINTFNYETLLGRAYLDEDGAANLDFTMTVADGNDTEIAQRTLDLWKDLLVTFAEFIGYYDGPSAADG